MAQRTAMSRLKAFWDSPTGLKTTHFWGPVANWGFVVAGISDSRKPAEVRDLTCLALCLTNIRCFWLLGVSLGPDMLPCLVATDVFVALQMISGNMTSVMCVYSALFMRQGLLHSSPSQSLHGLTSPGIC